MSEQVKSIGLMKATIEQIKAAGYSDAEIERAFVMGAAILVKAYDGNIQSAIGDGTLLRLLIEMLPMLLEFIKIFMGAPSS